MSGIQSATRSYRSGRSSCVVNLLRLDSYTHVACTYRSLCMTSQGDWRELAYSYMLQNCVYRLISKSSKAGFHTPLSKILDPPLTCLITLTLTSEPETEVTIECPGHTHTAPSSRLLYTNNYAYHTIKGQNESFLYFFHLFMQ